MVANNLAIVRPLLPLLPCARYHASPQGPMTHRQIQFHVLVTGHVQKVGYRASTRKMALQLNLRGWTRNLPDGRVEAVFVGIEPSVHAMVAWCQRGPLKAAVTDVATTRQPIEAFTGFDIRPTPPAPESVPFAEPAPGPEPDPEA